MANFTKAAIKASFLKLLDERPLSKITVKDIVEDCGINRNSFYYHFQDIPTLIEEIVTEEADTIIHAYPQIESIEKCLSVAVEFAFSHRRAALHMFHSAERDSFERYLWSVCEYVVTTYLDTVIGDKPIKDTDRQIIVRYYKCLCFGTVIDWMTEGMNGDIIESFGRLCELKKGMAEEIVRRSREG